MMNHWSWRVSATAVLLGLTLATAYSAGVREPEELRLPMEQFPETIGDWKVTFDERLGEDTEAVLKATDYVIRGYSNGEEWLEFFFAFYAMQRAGESMHSPRNCLPGAGWEMWDYDVATVDLGDREVNLNKYWVQRGRQRLLVYYWYQSGERVVANEYMAKASLVWDAAVSGRTSGSILRIILPDSEWADDAAMDFAKQVIPIADKMLP